MLLRKFCPLKFGEGKHTSQRWAPLCARHCARNTFANLSHWSWSNHVMFSRENSHVVCGSVTTQSVLLRCYFFFSVHEIIIVLHVSQSMKWRHRAVRFLFSFWSNIATTVLEKSPALESFGTSKQGWCLCRGDLLCNVFFCEGWGPARRETSNRRSKLPLSELQFSF